MVGYGGTLMTTVSLNLVAGMPLCGGCADTPREVSKERVDEMDNKTKGRTKNNHWVARNFFGPCLCRACFGRGRNDVIHTLQLPLQPTADYCWTKVGRRYLVSTLLIFVEEAVRCCEAFMVPREVLERS
jgi:hypothetical protein